MSLGAVQNGDLDDEKQRIKRECHSRLSERLLQSNDSRVIYRNLKLGGYKQKFRGYKHAQSANLQ